MTEPLHGNSSYAAYMRAAAIDLVRRNGPRTRRELADALGLSRTGIASLVDHLRDSGLAIEEDAPPVAGRPGRPPRIITLVQNEASSVLSLIVRPRRIEAVLVSSERTVTALRTEDTPLSADALESTATLVGFVTELMSETGVAPSAATLVLPTPVHTGGRINPRGARELMPTWLDARVIEQMRDELSLPVHVINETAASAVGEATSVGLMNERCVLYVKVGASGTAMCTLVDGNPFGGATGIAGQLGHISIRGHGVRCPCGQRGCIAAEIDYQVKEELERRRLHNPRITVEDLVRDASDEDPATRRFFYDIGIQLAPALGAAINVLEPSTVIVGGDLSDVDTGLLAGLESELSLSVHPGIAEGLSILRAPVGPIATAVGSAILLDQLAAGQ